MKTTFHTLGMMTATLFVSLVIVVTISISSLAAFGTKVSSPNGVDRSYMTVQTGDLSYASISVLYRTVYGLELTTRNYRDPMNQVIVRVIFYLPCVDASLVGKDVCSY